MFAPAVRERKEDGEGKKYWMGKTEQKITHIYTNIGKRDNLKSSDTAMLQSRSGISQETRNTPE